MNDLTETLDYPSSFKQTSPRYVERIITFILVILAVTNGLYCLHEYMNAPITILRTKQCWLASGILFFLGAGVLALMYSINTQIRHKNLGSVTIRD